MSNITSMATSYSSVQRQASQGAKGSQTIQQWYNNGLDATTTKIIGGADGQTQSWDSHGMLFREYDSIINTYDDKQLKIVNSTVAITDDNWKSTKTAIGNFYYYDPKTKELKNAYGINGEVIIGKLMLGSELGIYNQNGSLTFDDNGLVVTNGVNTVSIDPHVDSVLNIKNKDGNILSFDEDGDLIVVGNITAKSLTLLDDAMISGGHITGLSNVALSGDYNDLINLPVLSKVATSGSYNDLSDAPEEVDISVKFDNPTNEQTASIGQYLSKELSGSIWKDAEVSITEDGTLPVCGKAVYDFAFSKKQDASNAENLLYIDTEGNISFIGIDELKTLLGI